MKPIDDPDLLAARECARNLLPRIQSCADDALDPVAFWAGFFASVSGWAAASIGKEHCTAIFRVIANECPVLQAEEGNEVH